MSLEILVCLLVSAVSPAPTSRLNKWMRESSIKANPADVSVTVSVDIKECDRT